MIAILAVTSNLSGNNWLLHLETYYKTTMVDIYWGFMMIQLTPVGVAETALLNLRQDNSQRVRGTATEDSGH